MKRFMDSLFNGYITIKKNVTIVGDLTAILFKGTENNDLSIKRIPGNKIYFSKSNGDSPISNFGYFDLNTGNVVFNGIASQNSEHPNPQAGGIYYNTYTNTWYKCEDGTTWKQANI